MGSKKCNKCKDELPLSSFTKDKCKKDGLRTICKKCNAIATKAYYLAKSEEIKAYVTNWRRENKDKVEEYRLKNAESLREKERKRRANNPGRATEQSRQYYEKHAKRVIAQRRLHRAISSGQVVPMLCQVCGEKAHGHHPDYDRPLDVVWLCPKHHAQAHALVKELEYELG